MPDNENRIREALYGFVLNIVKNGPSCLYLEQLYRLFCFSGIMEDNMEKYPLQQQIPHSRQQFPLLLSHLQFNKK